MAHEELPLMIVGSIMAASFAKVPMCEGSSLGMRWWPTRPQMRQPGPILRQRIAAAFSFTPETRDQCRRPACPKTRAGHRRRCRKGTVTHLVWVSFGLCAGPSISCCTRTATPHWRGGPTRHHRALHVA